MSLAQHVKVTVTNTTPVTPVTKYSKEDFSGFSGLPQISDKDILVNYTELVPGDVVVGRDETIYGKRPFATYLFFVRREGVKAVFEWWNGEKVAEYKPYYTKFYIRSRVSQVDTGKFPHTCPYCKAKCYHGSYRIEHAVEPANCYAR